MPSLSPEPTQWQGRGVLRVPSGAPHTVTQRQPVGFGSAQATQSQPQPQQTQPQQAQFHSAQQLMYGASVEVTIEQGAGSSAVPSRAWRTSREPHELAAAASDAMQAASAQRAAEDAYIAKRRAEHEREALQKQLARADALEQEVVRLRQHIALQEERAEELQGRLDACNAMRQQELDTLQKEKNELGAKLQARAAMITQTHSDLEAYNTLMNEEHRKTDQLQSEINDLRKEREGHIMECSRYRKQCEELTETTRQLRRELQESADKAGGVQQHEPAQPLTSEGRLRWALAHSGSTTTAELREAVGAAEALLGEAKRELAARQLRERRAAFEALHAAIDRGHEGPLVEALAEARRTEVDSEDVQRGEAALAALKALTEEERALKCARERRVKNKEQAFLFVKRDDAVALSELLEGLDREEQPDSTPGPRWRDWKDHSGRTLLRCAQELRALRVQAALKPLIQVATSAASPERSPMVHSMEATMEANWKTPRHVEDRAAKAWCPAPALPTLASPRRKCTAPAPETTPEASTPLNAKPIKESPVHTSTENEAELRTQAFRAVVKDDTAALADVVTSRVPKSVWSTWQNKAGKDLLTLSEERGASGAYSLLAKALGLLKEQKRDSFEEREAVWVLFTGEVQPRRATVLEDTSAEAEDVFLEFWDGEEPASRIDRSFVLKSCA